MSRVHDVQLALLPARDRQLLAVLADVQNIKMEEALQEMMDAGGLDAYRVSAIKVLVARSRRGPMSSRLVAQILADDPALLDDLRDEARTLVLTLPSVTP